MARHPTRPRRTSRRAGSRRRRARTLRRRERRAPVERRRAPAIIRSRTAPIIRDEQAQIEAAGGRASDFGSRVDPSIQVNAGLNQLGLTQNQFNEYNKLLNQGVSQDIALTQSLTEPTRTPAEGFAEGLGSVLDFLSPLAGGGPKAEAARQGTLAFTSALVVAGRSLAQAAAGTDEQFFRSQAMQRASQLGLTGSAREQFIAQNIDEQIEAKRTDLRSAGGRGTGVTLTRPGAAGGRGTGVTRTRPGAAVTEADQAQIAAGRGVVQRFQAAQAFDKEVRELYADFLSDMPGPGGTERLPPDQVLGAAWNEMLARLKIQGIEDVAVYLGYPSGTSQFDILRDLGYIPATEDDDGLWILPDPPPLPSDGGSAGGFGFTGGSRGGGGGIGRGIGARAGIGLFSWRITA